MDTAFFSYTQHIIVLVLNMLDMSDTCQHNPRKVILISVLLVFLPVSKYRDSAALYNPETSSLKFLKWYREARLAKEVNWTVPTERTIRRAFAFRITEAGLLHAKTSKRMSSAMSFTVKHHPVYRFCLWRFRTCRRMVSRRIFLVIIGSLRPSLWLVNQRKFLWRSISKHFDLPATTLKNCPSILAIWMS